MSKAPEKLGKCPVCGANMDMVGKAHVCRESQGHKTELANRDPKDVDQREPVLPSLKPIPKKNRGRPVRSVIPKDTPFVDRTGPGGKAIIKRREPSGVVQKAMKAFDDKLAEVKALGTLPPSHPDCARCRHNRATAVERMRKLRGKK